MQPVQLSQSDSRVLAQIFDPESAPTRVEVLIDSSLPADKYVHDAALLQTLRATERKAVALIEDYEKSQTHQEKDVVYQKALVILDRLVMEHPRYASARNNRAQLRRWRYGDRNLLVRSCTRTNANLHHATAATVEDLRTAITLASPAKPTDAISPAQGRLLGQAYTQLAALFYATAKDFEISNEVEVACDDVAGWTRDSFEEEASRLFYLGGLYGYEVAKALAVHSNPHAKLCGMIVKEAMRKEFAPA